MTRICIIAARRTPQGRFLGALAGYSTLDLAAAAGKAALEKIDPGVIDLTIVGRVMPPDFNVARHLALSLGVPESSPAYTVNMMCASGLQAVLLAADAIKLGRASVVLCGGAESMSNVPHGLERSRSGFKFGDAKLVDYLNLGLTDPVINETMGQTAERLAERYKIDRAAQDRFALGSHQKAIAARNDGGFADELVALPELDHDEHPRADTTLEKLAGLKPAFKAGGSVTPGNASGINDGAAMAVLCDEETAQRRGWKPLAYFGAAVNVGCDPRVMGLGPALASRALCDRHRMSLDEFDTIEINEAFACQVLSCLRELKLSDDDRRVNPEGGAVAMGHPVGASGGRLLVHLAHRVARGRTKRGLASLCVGGGMGIAAAITER